MLSSDTSKPAKFSSVKKNCRHTQKGQERTLRSGVPTAAARNPSDPEHIPLPHLFQTQVSCLIHTLEQLICSGDSQRKHPPWVDTHSRSIYQTASVLIPSSFPSVLTDSLLLTKHNSSKSTSISLSFFGSKSSTCSSRDPVVNLNLFVCLFLKIY